jgi:DNA-binding GntR family transcriptional regulator
MARSSSPSRFLLANQILDFARNARFEAGHHLREQQLGDMLGVSRTPIRAALVLLAEKGIVEARHNQGFVLLKPFDALHHIEIEVPTTVDQGLYEQIVKDRLAGTIPPSLTQSEVADRYGVDRTVTLRTLSRLAEDGIIARNKGHGWTFLPTLDSSVALRSSYDFRLAIEPASFLLKTFTVNSATLERSHLQHVYLLNHSDIASVSKAQLFNTDAAFHEMFVEFSGNVFFLQSVQQQNRLRRLLEFGGYFASRRVRAWCQEHLSIIQAVRSNDLAGAADLMRHHLSRAYETAPAIDSSIRSAG